MSRSEDIASTMRGIAAVLRANSSATEQDLAWAKSISDAARALSMPALQDMGVLTAISDVLSSLSRSTLPTGRRYYIRDLQQYERGIAALDDIYSQIP